ncbi:hypothetical protein D3C71_1653610 [compost metagenome]
MQRHHQLLDLGGNAGANRVQQIFVHQQHLGCAVLQQELHFAGLEVPVDGHQVDAGAPAGNHRRHIAGAVLEHGRDRAAFLHAQRIQAARDAVRQQRNVCLAPMLIAEYQGRDHFFSATPN